MSNLYKQRYIQNEEKAVRVINSNQMIAKKIEQMTRQMQGQTAGTSGFSEGLDSQQVEEVQPEPEIDYVAEAKAQAQEEAKKILEQAQENAKAQVAAILSEAEKQKVTVLENAKAEGEKRGYEEGQAKAEAQLIREQKKLDERKQQLEQEYQKQLETMEPELVSVIAEVFEKVFHIQFADKTEILLALVSDAIMNVEGSKDFRIRVSNANFEFIDTHKAEIEQRVGNDVSLEIVADSLLEENQCTIEADSGVFDCSLGVQLENLIKDLKSLSID